MMGQSKFDQLRLRTDGELIQLASKELDLGRREARQALDSADNWVAAEHHYRAAERAYAEATRLIRLAIDAPEHERAAVKSRLESLREELDALSGAGSAPTDHEIAALARVLWKARGCQEGFPEQDWFRAERALKSHAVCVAN